MKPSLFNIVIPLSNDSYLLYNTLYRGMLEIEADYLKYLEAKNYENYEQDSVDAIKCFYENRFLVSDDCDELKLIQYNCSKEAYSSESLILTIAPTLDCNFACKYCYETHRKGVMGAKETNAVVAFIEERYESTRFKKLKINWYGGEPLLAFDQICDLSRQIITFCDEHEVEYVANMTTNGSLINQEVAEIIKQIRINTIQITLDGLGGLHDIRRPARNGEKYFDKIVQAIKLLDSMGVTISCRVNLDKNNISDYAGIVELFENNSNVYVHPGLLRKYDKTPKDEFDYYSLDEFSYVEHGIFEKTKYGVEDLNIVLGDRKIYCGAYKDNTFVIDERCNVYKCWNDIGNDAKIIFNIIEDAHTRGLNITALTEYMCYEPWNDEWCSKCNMLPICLGGCVYERKLTGEPYCFTAKKTIEEYILKYYKEVSNESN